MFVVNQNLLDNTVIQLKWTHSSWMTYNKSLITKTSQNPNTDLKGVYEFLSLAEELLVIHGY